MHHIISDAWSMWIMMEEFIFWYNKKKNTQASAAISDLEPLKFQYKDFVLWQNLLLSNPLLKPSRDFWLNKFESELPILELPYDFPRPLLQNPWGDKIAFTICSQLFENLKNMAANESTTLFIVLVAGLKVLLNRYTSQEDIIIGTLTNGRSQIELEKIIGYFVNILPLRDEIYGKMQFKQFLSNVRETVLNAFDNQDYPFDILVEELKINRDSNRSPVFDVMMVFQNFQDIEIKSTLDDLEIKYIKKDYVVNKYDLYLDIFEMTDQIEIEIEFRPELFKKETILRMKEHFLNILESISRSTDQFIYKLDTLSEREIKQILLEFNNTERDFPREYCFHRLFEQQVQETPERVAVVHNNHYLTYCQLNAIANQVAHHLVNTGITPNEIIGLLMKRSIFMLAAIIGVFKSGGAYLPIETDYPWERISYMIHDADVNIVIVEQLSTVKSLASVTCVEMETLQLDENSQINLAYDGVPDHYAYMIYTSGSTGNPKGVLVHQMGMINHLYAKINDLIITSGDRVAHTASHCFDISVWQFLAALLKGGITVIFDHETVLNPEELVLGFQKEHITIFEPVPSLLNVILQMVDDNINTDLSPLHWVIPTGEALKPSLAHKWFKYFPGIKMVNAYGPTEASDDITHYVISSQTDIGELSVSIGKPIQNMRIYILDQYLSLCPIGVRGEICVAGIGVGKGYWKDTNKTVNAFVPNPYVKNSDNGSYEILYKTGDIGYFREDGNIECLGRIDNQVKIRGFRIELEEIETVLLKHRLINDCAISVKKDTNLGDIIVAYYTEKEPINTEELKKHFLNYIPPYMVPSAFVQLEKIPLNQSGKVDRNALSAMELDLKSVSMRIEENYCAPQTPIEMQIVHVWQDVLQIEQIGIYDNFFDLGGHSLLIPRVFKKLNNFFPDKLQMADLFEYMTIQQLARYIDGKVEDEEEEIIELEL